MFDVCHIFLDILVLAAILSILWTMGEKRDITIQQYLDQEFQTQMVEKTDKIRRGMKQPPPEILKYMHNWNVRPVAHLVGSKIKKSRGNSQESEVTVTEWRRGHDGFVENGMTYRHGRLAVPISGVYKVYSLIDMQHTYNNGRYSLNQSSGSIHVQVYRYNILRRIQEELICSCLPYVTSSNRRFTVYRSFIAADLRLEAGDEVYIKVSNITFLKNPSSNVFGMYML